jgi:extracellular factor (EF) 3-hydroxypalmitic acid methyl ester biosynthesis protein
MATSYEDLVGGNGKSVNFRAERFLVRTLLAQQDVRIRLGGQEYPLHDLSMNGVSFLAPGDNSPCTLGDKLEVSVVARDRPLDGEPGAHEEVIYSGRARAVRATGNGSQHHVGLQLLGGFIDLAQVQWSYEKRSFRRDLAAGPDAVRRSVPADYRTAVERATHFVRSLRQTLDKHESRLAEMGEIGRRTIHELPAGAIESIRPTWLEICEQAARAAPSCRGDVSERRAAKTFTETMLTSAFMDCPMHSRSYHKPLGYAGDYQIMLQIYANAFDGGSVFSRVFHKLGCEEPLAAGVRSRKDLLRDSYLAEYARFCQAHSPGSVFRSTSLASGPAREVLEFISSQTDWQCPVHCSLVDQEEAALSVAHNDLYPKVQTLGVPVTLSCLYMSFMQCIRDPSSALSAEKQNFIYAAGLFDYLGRSAARTLVRALWDRLAPGGLLAIGNAIWPNHHFWMSEYVVDWHLLYRTRAEMLDLGESLSGASSVEVETDADRAYYFLLARKS